jgi:putative nucleotidyltransferase with HDIG domain
LMLLGFNTVRNAVVSIDVINALNIKSKIKGFDISSFWRHAIGVAVISRYLDQATGRHYREDVFTAGIIHDIGKVVMAHYFSDQFQAVLETMQQEQLNFWDAEHRHFPLNHAEIGAELAKRWHLPEPMRNVIGRHHTSSKNKPLDNLVHIVHTADALFHVFLENNSPTEDWPISFGARQLLKQQIRSADQWIAGLKREIKEACQMLMEV